MKVSMLILFDVADKVIESLVKGDPLNTVHIQHVDHTGIPDGKNSGVPK